MPEVDKNQIMSTNNYNANLRLCDSHLKRVQLQLLNTFIFFQTFGLETTFHDHSGSNKSRTLWLEQATAAENHSAFNWRDFTKLWG